MDYIVAGQRIVTAAEFIEAAAGFGSFDFEPAPGFAAADSESLAAQRDALAGLLDDVRSTASTEDDELDVAYYEQLLRRMPTPIRRRPAGRRIARTGVAA